MSFRSRLRSLWRNVAHRDRVERDLDHELSAAFELLVDEHLQKGAPPAEARRAATLQLGRIDSIKTQVRDVRGGAGLETLWHDIRFSLRLLGRNRSFTTAAIVSLALGMGASGTVFGLLNALRLRSLPVAHAAELAEIQLSGPRCCRHTGRNRQVSLPLWQEIVRQQQGFSALFAFADTRFNLAPQGEVRYVEGLYVSGEFFPVLGVTALRGRMLTPADDRAGCANAPARHQPRAVAGRVRRRRGRPVANTHPPLGPPPHRRHRSRNLPGRGGGPPFRGGAPRLRRGIRSSRSLVAGGHGPARARVDAVRR